MKILQLALYLSAITIFNLANNITTHAENKTENKNVTEKFKVGVIAPLSGPLAEYGIAIRNGIELSRENHPELFTLIDFIYEDSQWDPKLAVSSFNKLTQINNVSLVYNFGNPTSDAISPIAEKQQIPLIAMTLDPKIAHNKKFVIRGINPVKDFSSKLAEYLKSKKFGRLGVIITENTYTKGLYDELSSSLEASGYSPQSIEIISKHNMNEYEFRSTVTKLSKKNYDAIGVFLITGQISNFYKNLSQNKISTPTFGTDFFESSTEIKKSNGKMNGAVYPNIDIIDSFKAAYLNKFKNDLQISYAGNAYDIAYLIGINFNELKEALSAEQIISKLKNEKINYDGVSGKFNFKETPEGDSYFNFPVSLKIISNDTFQTIK